MTVAAKSPHEGCSLCTAETCVKNSKLLISALKLHHFLQNNIINILTKIPFRLQHTLCFEIMKR